MTCFPPGKVVAPANKGGMPFLARRAVVWFSPPKAAFILAPLGAPYLASAAVLHNSRGRSPQPVREASAGPGQNPGSPGPSGPAAPSPLAAKPRQPSGIQVSADSSQRPMTSNVAHSKKALTITVSAFSVNQQLPILPGRFQPSTFGVCELNYRVRHGYGCILTAIATESLRVCSLKTA